MSSDLRRRKTARDVQVMKSQVRKEKSLLRSKLLSRENSVTGTCNYFCFHS